MSYLTVIRSHDRKVAINYYYIVCKTVRPMLSDRYPVLCPVLSVCDVGVLWPNGWTDQDETWRAGRPRTRPHCIRWGASSPSPKREHIPQFSAHVYCGQTAGWIKMPLGSEVRLGSGDIVLDGGQVPPTLPPEKGHSPQFSAHVYCGHTVAHLSCCFMLAAWCSG